MSCEIPFSGLEESAIGWSTFYHSISPSTPDLFNECATNAYTSVPDNNVGIQSALSGSGYAGFIPVGVTESILGTLNSPLIRDSLYYVSYNLSLADRFDKAMRDIGLVFLDSIYTINADSFYTVQPDLVETAWITDKQGWHLVDTIYMADGNETHLAIAYFPNEDIYETLPGQGGDLNSTYYYVDDVSVVPYSIWLGIKEPEFIFSIHPNPATTNLTIESRTPLAQVWVRDVAGRAIMNETLRSAQSDKHTIDVSGLPNGIYLVEVLTQNGQRSVQKVVVE